jgi:DNA-binding HxlR family transcriptional regulator
MDLLGDAWTPLIMREAFYGFRRFDEFQSELGIARNTLADRLRRLVDAGVFEKSLYQTEPNRYEYVLTEMGNDFFGVIAAISAWGDRWLAGKQGPPVMFHHDSCDHDSGVEVVCTACGEPLRAADTTMRMGPGYPKALSRRAHIQQRFAMGKKPVR